MISPGASDKMQKMGLHVYQAGIGVQQAVILAFFAVIIGFHRKMVEMERDGWRDSHRRSWKLMIWVLYAVLVLISVSSFTAFVFYF